MRLSRTDLVAPVLAIVAGGVIGVSLTFSPVVLWSPSGDVPVPDPVVAPSPTLQIVRIEVPPVRIEVQPIRIEVPTIQIEVPTIRLPNEEWILCRDPDTDELTRFEARTDGCRR